MESLHHHRPPRPINIQNVTLTETSTLSWDWVSPDDALTYPISHASLAELVFVLDPSNRPSSSGYILVILRESEQGEGESESGREEKSHARKLFDLVALRVDAIPLGLRDRCICITSFPEHLVATPRNDVDVVVSTKSGVGLALTFWTSVLQPLWALVEEHLRVPSSSPTSSASPNAGKASPSVFITRDAQSIREIARSFTTTPHERRHPPSSSFPSSSLNPPSSELSHPFPPPVSDTPPSRTVVLLSGDGGVVDILNAVAAASPDHPPRHPEHDPHGHPHPRANTRPPSLALIPLGTANALFHSLHKPVWDAYAHARAETTPAPSPLALALVTLFTGVSAQLPVFRASFSPGSVLVHQPSPSASPSPGPAAESTSNTPPEDEKQQQQQQQEEGRGDGGAKVVVKDGGAAGSLPVEHLYGAVVASYGFHASIVYESDTPEYRVHGDKRFAMVAQNLLRESHAYLADVLVRPPLPPSSPSLPSSSPPEPSSLDPQQRREEKEKEEEDLAPRPHQKNAQQQDLAPISDDPQGRHGYVLITPLSNLERTFTISPASKPLDPTLRLVHFGPIGPTRTMDVMMAAYDAGRHVGMSWPDGERVLYAEVDEVRVTTREEDPRWRKACVDGTIVEIPRGGSFSVRREESRLLDVLCPYKVSKSLSLR